MIMTIVTLHILALSPVYSISGDMTCFISVTQRSNLDIQQQLAEQCNLCTWEVRQNGAGKIKSSLTWKCNPSGTLIFLGHILTYAFILLTLHFSVVLIQVILGQI